MPQKGGLTRFTNCWVLRDHKIKKDDFWIRNGQIMNPEELFFVEKVEADVVINCQDALIAPGFIDIQINGGWGVDFTFDKNNVEGGVSYVAKALLAHGVTSFCPTIVTSDVATYNYILPKIKKRDGGHHGATILGVHLEGPFISLDKKGAHAEEFIRNPIKGMQSLYETYGTLDDVCCVTIAPELDGALEAIKGLTERGISVSVGHSSASLAEGEEAVRAGANLITHLFNAMLPFHHRDPGLVGLLASPVAKDVHYGIIADGIHTHPAALRIACRMNAQGIVLVSDAISALGLEDGQYQIGTKKFTMDGGRAYISGTKTLCGSTTGLDACVRCFQKATDCSVEYAIEAASLHPARALGIDHKKGTLRFGADADFVLLHKHSLTVLSTWINGQCVYKSK